MCPRFLLIIILFTSLTQLGFTQRHRSHILDEKAVPINQLPTTVKTPGGQLSLWADFSTVHNESITVYLINKTEGSVNVPTQDGNPYIKIEGLISDEQWVRAEPHVYSWCGNSYFNSPNLPKGHFLRISAWYPNEGSTTQVRYTIFGALGVTSNQGLGQIQPKAIQEAEYDAMAIRFGDIDLIRTVILEKKGADNTWPNLINNAIRRLEDFPPQQIIPILEAILDDSSYDKRAIDDSIRTYSKHAPDKARNLLLKQLMVGDTDTQKHILSMHDQLLEQDERYLPFLENHCRNPESALRFDAMRAYIRLLGEDAKMPLLGILRSTEDEQTRRYIQMLWERKFGEHRGIRLKVNPLGNLNGNSIENSILVEITLTNFSKQEQTFRYQSPIELFNFWVTSGNTPIPLKSRHTLPTSTEVEGPSTTVQMSPGDTHTMIIDLRNFFDSTDLVGKSITYYVRCCLPNIHEEPFVDSTGYGIRID